MLIIHCRHCQKSYLVGARSILSLQQTPDGPLAQVRCPEGHVTATDFGRGTVNLPPAEQESTPTPATERKTTSLHAAKAA